MKQPELGRKISASRKAKGLTQEELVELCNINVRTIQRIEAGEVTPRTYTLRLILNALEIEVDHKDIYDDISTSRPSYALQRLKYSFILGILYIIASFVESALEYLILQETFTAVSGIWYTAVKLVIFVTFTGFMYGFYVLSIEQANKIIHIGSLLFIGASFLSIGKDIYIFYLAREYYLALMMTDSLIFGALNILFGVGMINYQKKHGTLALVSGCLSIITGLAFISIIFAIPGLFILTIVEILLLIFLYNASQYHIRPKGSESIIDKFNHKNTT